MNQENLEFEAKLMECVQEGFESALEFRHSEKSKELFDNREFGARNKLFSSVFVSEVSTNVRNNLANLFPMGSGLKCKFINVGMEGKRKSGEWLLDMCVVETEEFSTEYRRGRETKVRVFEKMLFAMESEADTSAKSFAEDFAKLLVVDSSHKLYLNGVDQRKPAGLCSYIQSRNRLASNILKRNRKPSSFYMGYWPSPGQPSWKERSLWDCLEKHEHLNKIRLFRYQDGCMVPLA